MVTEDVEETEINPADYPKELEAVLDVCKLFAPPTKQTVAEWAEDNFILSSDYSAEPGLYKTDKAPYQKGILDAFNDASIETIVLKTSAQVGKSLSLQMMLAYTIEKDPAPALVVLPTLDNAKAFSKERLSCMFRDIPTLRAKLINEDKTKAKDTDNTILSKKYKGGAISLAGANSPASLAARAVRYLFLDEIDRFEVSAGAEGSPIQLAIKRTTTYFNRKIIMCSTPTCRDSNIDKAYNDSDQRKYHVPCPHCGEFQIMMFGQIKFDTNEYKQKGKIINAYYECPKCQGHITDKDKLALLNKGKWIADKPANGTAGFWINELYSPWVSFADISTKFLDAKKHRDLQPFMNTSLAEYFENKVDTLEVSPLFNRREDYNPAIVPLDALLITAGVDVQEDRIEVSVYAWAENMESWNLDHRVFLGNPATPAVWADLDDYLKTTYKHESGLIMPIHATAIDTGGSMTDATYRYCKGKLNRNIFAIKGSSSNNSPIYNKPSKGKTKEGSRVKLHIVGVSTAKDTIYKRLQLTDAGAGYLHYPKARTLDFFEQLIAETIKIKKLHGQNIRVWEKRTSDARNEALDCLVYAMAALHILNPLWSSLLKNHTTKVYKLKGKGTPAPVIETPVIEPQEELQEETPIETPIIKPEPTYTQQIIKQRVQRIIKKPRGNWLNKSY